MRDSYSFSLHKVNEYLHSRLKDQEINNIKLFACKDKSKISVTLLPLMEEESKYHGLHPKFNIENLLKFLRDNEVNTTEEFWNSVGNLQKKEKLMNLIIDKHDIYDSKLKLSNKEDKLHLESILLGRAILQMCSRFGFKINILDTELAEEFINKLYEAWSKYSDYFKIINDENKKDKNLFWKYNRDTSEIFILGIWPKEIIDILSDEYYVKIDEKSLILGKKNISNDNESNILKQALCFSSKYLEYFTLCNSNIYYSGVMPKVKHIKFNDDIKYSNDVKSITLEVVKTTFATVDFMDNPLIINHAYFKQDLNKYKHMQIFDNYEDVIQQKYLYSNCCITENTMNDEYEKLEIENINKYLARSLNTNTVAVSSNIVTSDELLIVGKRSNLSIDGGEYYCSVNGQSEFKDENVDFYYQSVYEDLPSLEYNSRYRVDLDNETKRETIAELGICNLNSVWNYYGISYLSRNNFPDNLDSNISLQESMKVNKRRMHFNVLSSNTTDLKYREVLMNSNNAVEKFENSKILGLKLFIYKNKSHKIKVRFIELYNWIENNSSRIFLFILFLTVIFRKDNLTYDDMGGILQFVFLLIYLFIISKEWYDDKNIRKLQTKINYTLSVNNMNIYDEFFEVVQKKSEGKDKVKLHAIFYLMFILFLDDKLNEL